MEAQLERDGFEIRRGMVDGDDLEKLREEVSRLQAGAGKVCVRDILKRSEKIQKFARSCIPADGMIAVRGILFDKTPEENWPVPWHQDLSIAIAERPVEAPPGYGAWTVKDGIPHVQPPVVLLEKMITLRLHLDDTPEENGALRVVPGSHRSGKLAAEELGAELERGGERICTASAGDLLLMKPLVLHSSARLGRGGQFAHRRVIHLEFAPALSLAPGLGWYDATV